MELGLSLALSSTNHLVATTTKLKELDLITHVNCKVKQVYDDDNSTLLSQSSVNYHNDDEDDEENNSICYVNHGMKKRSFEVESFVFGNTTLPLLHWDKEDNEDNKVPKRLCNSTSFTFHKSEEEGILVGWPPIKSYRKKWCHQQNDDGHRQHHQYPGRRRCFQGGACGGFRSMYVKVQMEGFIITRKVDLKLYHSYQSLAPSLLTLFGKGEDSVESYKFTYQDKDGDWLLVGDVPWRTFVGSVQRLKLIRRDV